jgi:hypothetical protein
LELLIGNELNCISKQLESVQPRFNSINIQDINSINIQDKGNIEQNIGEYDLDDWWKTDSQFILSDSQNQKEISTIYKNNNVYYTF